MPFKSKDQQSWMFAAQKRGELPKGTAEKWAKHTPDMKKLPERVHNSPPGAVAHMKGRLHAHR